MLRDVRVLRAVRSLLIAAATLTASTAFPFVRTLSATNASGGKHYLWWPTRQVSYQIQSDCAPLNPAAIAAGEDAASFGVLCRSAIARSFQSWQDASTDAGVSPCSNL